MDPYERLDEVYADPSFARHDSRFAKQVKIKKKEKRRGRDYRDPLPVQADKQEK